MFFCLFVCFFVFPPFCLLACVFVYSLVAAYSCPFIDRRRVCGRSGVFDGEERANGDDDDDELMLNVLRCHLTY